LRAPPDRFDPDALRDAVEALFAAERDFEAFEPVLLRAVVRFAADLLDFVPRAEERAAPFDPELFFELFVERLLDEPLPAELFELALLRDAADFFAPPLRAVDFDALFLAPEPLLFPPPSCLLTVAHARRSASSSETPRLS
jgi:hypothetical protein